jgi:hypothetical protein
MKFKVMRTMISVGFLSIAATIVAVSIQVPAQAAKLTGSFDWDIDKEIPHNSENKLINFIGEATFMIDKHSRTGMITFSDLKIDNNLLPLPNPDFDIISDSIMFGEEWKLEMFEFKNNIAEGTIDLVTKKASFNFIPENPSIITDDITIQNITTIKHTPEPTSTLAFLTLGTIGAASTLKDKLKLSKSADKELEKAS